MARVLTTSFLYNGKSYAAVISHLDGAVSIYVPDESLHGILPNGKAIYNSKEGLKIDTPKLTPQQCLLLSILTSLEVSAEVKSINIKRV